MSSDNVEGMLAELKQPTSSEKRREASTRGWLPSDSPHLVLRMAQQGYEIAKDGSFRNPERVRKKALKAERKAKG